MARKDVYRYLRGIPVPGKDYPKFFTRAEKKRAHKLYKAQKKRQRRRR